MTAQAERPDSAVEQQWLLWWCADQRSSHGQYAGRVGGPGLQSSGGHVLGRHSWAQRCSFVKCNQAKCVSCALLLLLLCPADAGQGMHHVAESSAHHQQGEQQQLCHYSAVLHAVRTVHDTKPAAAQQLAMSLSNAGKVTKSD